MSFIQRARKIIVHCGDSQQVQEKSISHHRTMQVQRKTIEAFQKC